MRACFRIWPCSMCSEAAAVLSCPRWSADRLWKVGGMAVESGRNGRWEEWQVCGMAGVTMAGVRNGRCEARAAGRWEVGAVGWRSQWQSSRRSSSAGVDPQLRDGARIMPRPPRAMLDSRRPSVHRAVRSRPPTEKSSQHAPSTR